MGKTEYLKKRCLKRVGCDMDYETYHQMCALARHWKLSRNETILIMIDWGMEKLDGKEKELCEKAARNSSIGAV